MASSLFTVQGAFEVVLKEEDDTEHPLFSKLDTYGPAKNRAYLPDLLAMLDMIKTALNDSADREEKTRQSSGKRLKRTAEESRETDAAKEKEAPDADPVPSKPRRVAKRRRGEAISN